MVIRREDSWLCKLFSLVILGNLSIYSLYTEENRVNPFSESSSVLYIYARFSGGHCWAEWSVCGPWTSSISITWELIRKAGTLAPSWAFWIRNSRSETQPAVMSQILYVILSGTCLSLEAPPTQDTDVNRTHTLYQGRHSWLTIGLINREELFTTGIFSFLLQIWSFKGI